MNALSEGENRRAYNLMCESSKADMTFWEFQKQIAPSEVVTRVEVETKGGGFFHVPPITHARFHFSDGVIVEKTYEAVADAATGHGDLYVCDPPPFDR